MQHSLQSGRHEQNNNANQSRNRRKRDDNCPSRPRCRRSIYQQRIGTRPRNKDNQKGSPFRNQRRRRTIFGYDHRTSTDDLTNWRPPGRNHTRSGKSCIPLNTRDQLDEVPQSTRRLGNRENHLFVDKMRHKVLLAENGRFWYQPTNKGTNP